MSSLFAIFCFIRNAGKKMMWPGVKVKEFIHDPIIFHFMLNRQILKEKTMRMIRPTGAIKGKCHNCFILFQFHKKGTWHFKANIFSLFFLENCHLVACWTIGEHWELQGKKWGWEQFLKLIFVFVPLTASIYLNLKRNWTRRWKRSRKSATTSVDTLKRLRPEKSKDKLNYYYWSNSLWQGPTPTFLCFFLCRPTILNFN